jgi:hypothetical protein
MMKQKQKREKNDDDKITKKVMNCDDEFSF